MAKKEVFVCDKCGKEFEPTEWTKGQLKFTVDIKEDGSRGNNLEFDLCHNCCYAYIEFMFCEMQSNNVARHIRNFIPAENLRIVPR
jgi:hypothetical protein